MKDIVVFSGGGSRGIFQVGAFLALKANQDFNPIFFGGSSVGALNAAFFACDKSEVLTRAWTDIKDNPTALFPSDFLNDKSQFSLSFKGFRRIIKHFFTRKKINGLVDPNLKSILENISLKDLIDSEFNYPKRLFINAVSLESGESFTVNASALPSDEQFHELILASASFPGIFPSVDHVRTFLSMHNYCIDAGVREVTTLREIINHTKSVIFSEDQFRITIINCNVTNPLPSPVSYDSIDKNINRAIDIARHTIFKQEIALFKERNQIGAPHYRRFTYRIIEPDPAEIIGVMDFSKESLDRLYQHGKEQALTADWVD